MQILADTQIVVWSFDNGSPLSAYRRNILQDAKNRVVMSYISLMELAIKKSIGKLPYFIPEISEVAQYWISNGFEILPLTASQIFNYTSIPIVQNHKDPFDRFLIAVAKTDNLTLMTEDSKFKHYESIIDII